ncbi:OLC1v1028710C1 [Oldenlandia corymbosa var. corymbosa]|uniref:OLC1v1028710C1 n=1 Tax=Oldenlandia corymbosa var. corymbosa TaxID=529605 RepID=A0AAV1CCD1_OLDCO|nr:OLC1v1028710C1 [Oldenlandia corymbosa var. corymbosa]
MDTQNPPHSSSPQASSIDPKSGFCCKTKTFHSIRPAVTLPFLPTAPISITSYIFRFLHHSSSSPALLDPTVSLSYRRVILHSELESRVKSLAYSLHHEFRLSKGDRAFILSLNSPEIPILYLALFAIGVLVSPSNPANTPAEILQQLRLSKPAVAFTSSDDVHKLPSFLRRRNKTLILLDSPDFYKMMLVESECGCDFDFRSFQISQSDTAAILYSSGTTGSFKGVELTHRNIISSIAGSHATRPVRKTPAVILCALPVFHVYGFMVCLREVAMGGTVVLTKKYNLESILRNVDELKVTHLAAAPPLVVAMAKTGRVATRDYDLRSLEAVFCGGAQLVNSVIQSFWREFPGVAIAQGYGLTETTAGATRIIGPNESRVLGSVGRLMPGCQAKIVDPKTPNGPGLPPLQEGEIWIRGLYVMKGYAGEKEATDAIIDSDGWLRTGDIGYFDNEGFLFYVERMKDLIKYKGYQVAPAELEHLLQSHPDIADAAVIPYPDEDAGQIPVAFVVRKPGGLINETQIIDFVANQGKYKSCQILVNIMITTGQLMLKSSY